MDSVRPKRLKKRQTGRVGAVEAEFFNGLLEKQVTDKERLLVQSRTENSRLTQLLARNG